MKMYRYSVVYYDKYDENYVEDHGITVGENVNEAIKNINKDYGEQFEAIKIENCYIEGARTASFDELKVALTGFVSLNPEDYE